MHTPIQGSILVSRCREGDARRLLGVGGLYNERGGRYFELTARFDSRHAAGFERPGSTLLTPLRGVEACTLQLKVVYWSVGVARATQDDCWGWEATMMSVVGGTLS